MSQVSVTLPANIPSIQEAANFFTHVRLKEGYDFTPYLHGSCRIDPMKEYRIKEIDVLWNVVNVLNITDQTILQVPFQAFEERWELYKTVREDEEAVDVTKRFM